MFAFSILQLAASSKSLASTTTYEVLRCEHNSLELECPRGSTIDVLSASYGRKAGPEICPHPATSNRNCHAASSLTIVKASCQGKSNCRVLAKNHIFGDPCGGTFKYLTAKFRCVAPEAPHMESGALGDIVDHNKLPVTFKKSFDTVPHVFAGVLTIDGGDAAVPAVEGITKNGAKVFVDEPVCHDGWHTTEQLDWMAFEDGIQQTDEGKPFLVGSKMSSTGRDAWVQVDFPTGLFSDDIVVIATAQSDEQRLDDNKWYNIRVQNVNKRSFQFHVEGEYRSYKQTKSLKVSYFVIEQGSGHIDSFAYNALTTKPRTLRENLMTVATTLSAPLLASSPLIFASVSHFGSDTASLRMTKASGRIMFQMHEPTACGWDGPHPMAETAYIFLLGDKAESTCHASNCNQWTCTEWCNCYKAADEQAKLYENYGCADDGEPCEC